MFKSYEALLDHGQIRWLESEPDVEEARVIVTVLPSVFPNEAVTPVHPTEEVDQLLARTAGAWSKRPATEVNDPLYLQHQADWGHD